VLAPAQKLAPDRLRSPCDSALYHLLSALMSQPQTADTGFVALHITLREGAAARSKHIFLRPQRSTQVSLGGTQKAYALGERALFIAGLPFLHCDHEAVVERLFEAFGGIERVAVHADQVRPWLAFLYVHCHVPLAKAAFSQWCFLQAQRCVFALSL